MSIEDRTAARELALLAKIEDQRRLASPDDYVFDKAQEAFWDMRDNTLHSEKAVDASIPIALWRVEVTEPPAPDPSAAPKKGRPAQRKERAIPPSKDIMRVENDKFVEGSTWWPGMPQVIEGIFIDGDGHRPAKGRRIYNQFRPPPEVSGNPVGAQRWVDHVRKLWPKPAEHNFFFDACAHMVQRPHEKLNGAVVMSGTQGIGKDAALLPVKRAVGTWNTKGIDPDELFSTFRPWLQTLMLVIDEVRPTKDEFHASSMYNILKPMAAAPPETLPLNDKHAKLRHIINVLRVFITTNDWMSMYIPPEDRRMFIMHSDLPKEWHLKEGQPQYFTDMFRWLDSGGSADVAAWLWARDLREFNPKLSPVKTEQWAAITSSWGEAEDEVSRSLDMLGRPEVVIGQELVSVQFDGVREVANMLKSPRKIGHRMQKAGYREAPPPNGEERWTFRGPGRTIRTRNVFVRDSILALGAAHVLELVKNHGNRVAGAA